MSNYTITTDFGAKDSLPSGNAAKVIKGSEFTTEFTNIQTAVATKLDLTSGSATNLTTTGTLTNSGAMTTTGVSTFNGAVNFASTTAHAGNATFSDNAKAIFGAGADLQIYHDGTDTHIVESGAGSLKIKGNFLQLLSPDNEKFFEGQANGASSLFYNGVAKLDTSDDGVSVTGQSMKLTGANPLFYLLDNTNTNTCSLQNTDGNFKYNADSGNQIGNSRHTFFIDGTEAMRIDTTGVGIGTTSPTNTLTVRGASTTGSSSTGNVALLQGPSGTNGLKIFVDDTENAAGLQTIATDDLLLNPHGGNVGIGTTSPAYAMDISQTSNASPVGLRIQNSEGSFILRTNGNQTLMDAGADLIFRNSSETERMRIDSSGNLLVGTTVTNSTGSSSGGTTTGVEFQPSGELQIGSDGDKCAIFNRQSSDGEILRFRKDGTTVGSIGTSGSRLYFSNNVNDGIKIADDYVAPCNQTGVDKDASLDLGSSSVRFKDLYRSGSTYSTSDRNKKQDIRDLTDAEARVATVAKGSLKAFRYIDSVEAKGDEANIHFGIIAQDLKAAFEAEGLNANDYQVFKTSTYTDDDGVEQTTYSICYENLLAFIIAAI